MSELRRDLSPVLGAFPRERRWLLPALKRVQTELGSLPLWALEAVGEHLRVPPSDLYGVATHYPELHLEAPGRHVVRVCTGLSCRVLGALDLLEALRASAADTDDGKLVLEEIPCAFICSVAPIVEIDGAAHGGLSAEKAAALVRERLAGEDL